MSREPAATVPLASLQQRGLALWLRLRYSVELLVERRLWFFALVDAYLVLITLFVVLSSGGQPQRLYLQIVVLPNLIIALPVLANVIAVERRSGALDLALATPSTEAYFVRRVLPICALLFLQGNVVISLIPYIGPWQRAGALIASALVSLLMGAVTLFWAVRLRSAGGVLVASLLTVLLLGKWVFFAPFPARYELTETFRGIPVPVLEWIWNSTVLAGATLLFYLYARQRLRRPETML